MNNQVLPATPWVAKLLTDTEIVSPKGIMLNLFRISFRGRVAESATKYAAAILRKQEEIVILDPDGFGLRLQTDQCWTAIAEVVKDVCKDIAPTTGTLLGIFDSHRSALHFQTDDGKTAAVKLYSRLHTQHKANFDHISKKVLEPCSEPPGKSASNS